MAGGQFLAYAFKSNLSLKGMLERLNEAGPWKWVMGEKDEFGEYLHTRPFKGFAKYRVFAEPEPFVFDIYYSFLDHGAEEAWETQHAIILNEILPTLGARDVKPTENYG